MERIKGKKLNWKSFKFRMTFFLIIVVSMSLTLTGCLKQHVSEKVETNNIGTYSNEQSQGSSSPESLSTNNGSSTSKEADTSVLNPESMISASQLDDGIKAKKNWVIMDVREKNEFANGHVPTAINIPLGTLEQNLNQFPKDKEIIFVCLNGSRAFTAWQTLIRKGYELNKIKILIGGMEQWKTLGSGEVTESIGGC
ncbi:rhodanese-like domain-containing protein [Desulfitobacterium sp. AusDCA]|uniref:rhodanese-like domain-containing protein n=1 Tax=Desulfitobacterium sp. AusDCA TaxID=3240383 RepID=UPI003DA77289